MRRAAVVILGIGFLFAFDYFFDLPHWLQIPGLWECGNLRNAGIEFCPP